MPQSSEALDASSAEESPQTLESLLQMALENNPATREAWFAAKAGLAAYKGSLSEYYPHLAAAAQLRYRDTIDRSVPSEYSGGEYGPAINLRWLLFDCGERKYRATAFLNALSSKDLLHKQACQDLMLDVTVTYYNLYQAKASLDASQAFLENARTAHGMAVDKAKMGIGREEDVLSALAGQEMALAETAKAASSVETARAALSRNIGRRVSPHLDIVPPTWPEKLDALSVEVAELTRQALHKRPALLNACALAKEAEANVMSAKAKRWPTLSAGISDERIFSLDQESASDFEDLRVGLMLEWDIFDGFKRTYDVIQSQEKLNEAFERVKGEELAAVSDVWSSYFEFDSTRAQLVHNRAALAAQQQYYHMIATGYETGLNSMMDLLTSQKDLFALQLNLSKLESDFGIALAKLAHSTGSVEAFAPYDQGTPTKQR